jgi:hypothetical protein
VSAAQAQASEAAAMAAAMAEVEAEEAAAAEAEAVEEAAAAAAAAEAAAAAAAVPPLPGGQDSLDGQVAEPLADRPPSEKVKQIERLYMRHNPEKLDELDDLLDRFGEDKLLAMIKKKYGDVDPQERIAEITYLITQKQTELRQAVAAGGTHNMTRIDQLQREQKVLQDEKAALETPRTATGSSGEEKIDTAGMSAEQIIRVYQKLDMEAQEKEQALRQECAEEMRELNEEIREAKQALQTYVATHGTADMAGTLPLTEQIQQLESIRESRQRETNKQASKIQADLERKKAQLKGTPAAGAVGHGGPGPGGRRASISERMLGSIGLGPEAAGAPGEAPRPTALRRLSVSLSGGAQAAQQEAEQAARLAAEEKRREEQAEAQKAAALAEQGRKIVVRKDLMGMYRRYCPDRLGDLDPLIEELGADEVMKMTREEFREELREDQVELIFDFLGVIGTDVSAEDVARSFENVGYAPDTWLKELKDMHANGEVEEFLSAVQHGTTEAPAGEVLPENTPSVESVESLPASSAGGSYDSMDDIAAEAYSEPGVSTMDDDELREMQELRELEGLTEVAEEEAELLEEDEGSDEVEPEAEPTTPSSRVTAFSGDQGFVPDTKYDCKLNGKSVQVTPGGMGLQVFPKKGAPTTHIYQTLLGWTQNDGVGFEVDTADGKLLQFHCDDDTAAQILKGMGKHALKLAKAVQANQRDSSQEPPSKPIKLESIQSEGSHGNAASSGAGPEEIPELGERKYNCKLNGKSVQVSCGGMGVQVFPKRGAPTTYIYQTLLGWMATDSGFELNTADGKTLSFDCDHPDEGVEVIDDITAAAQALAKAQHEADREAGMDLSDHKRLEDERKAKARSLAQAAQAEPNAPADLAASSGPEEAETAMPPSPVDGRYECKLGGKSVQVAAGGMGLQVFSKKGGGAPTTYIYQTLLGWQVTDKGVDVEMADGKRLLFVLSEAAGAGRLVDEITESASALAKAQRKADQKAEQTVSEPESKPQKKKKKKDSKRSDSSRGSRGSSPSSTPSAELQLPEAAAAADASSWRQQAAVSSRGGIDDSARYHWAVDARTVTSSPLIEELVLALPPLGGTRSAPHPLVADLCIGAGVAASAVLRAYPDVSMTLVAADEDALYTAKRQIEHQQQQQQQLSSGWTTGAPLPPDVASVVLAIEGSWEDPIRAPAGGGDGSGGGGYDVIIAAQSLRELLSGHSSLEDGDDGSGGGGLAASELLDGYRWLFAKVLASLKPGGTFLVADETDTLQLGLYGHMRLLEEAGFGEIDCAWRQGNSFVCGGSKAIISSDL